MKRLIGGLGLLALAALEVGAIALLAPGGTIPYWVLVLPAATAISGFLLMFSHAIESHFGAFIEKTERNLQQDVKTFEEGSTTRVRAMVIITALAAGVELVLLVVYHKWDAAWGSTSVLFVSVVAVLCAVLLGTRNKWYLNRNYTTPKWVFLIPLAGFALSALLGTYYTEPVSPAQGAQYDYSQTRASGSGWHGTYFFTNSSSDNSGVSVPKCSGKGCGYAYLLLFLILIVLLCIVGSATIPHFWVLATLLMLTFMVIIILHEYLVLRESRRTAPAGTETTPSDESLSQSSTIVQTLRASFAGRLLLVFFHGLIDRLKDPVFIGLAPFAFVVALLAFFFYLEGVGNLVNLKRNNPDFTLPNDPIVRLMATRAAEAEVAAVTKTVQVAPTATAAYVSAAASASAAFKSTEAWKVIISDKFDDNRNGWTIGEGQSIAGGKYAWDTSHPTGGKYVLRGFPQVPALSDFALSIDAWLIAGSDCRIGLAFRSNMNLGSESGYGLFIGDDKSWSFQRFSPDGTYSVQSGDSDALTSGEPNRLTVMAQGSHLTFFVNGKYVAEAEDRTYAQGKLGAAVLNLLNNRCHAEFDNFEVRAP